jgi:hypothetical protein
MLRAGFVLLMAVSVAFFAAAFGTANAFLAAFFGFNHINDRKNHDQSDHANGNPGFLSHIFLLIFR